MEIQCCFEIISYSGEEMFGCVIKNQQIPDNQELKLIGQYEDGKTNGDVHFVYFELCTVTKIPQGLTKIFPNLKILEIDESKLKEISKNDLVEYKNLAYFFFNNNEIEFLPGDLFEDFPNLEIVSFEKNKLKVIEPNILDGFEKLKYVDFRGNLNYKMLYSSNPKWKPNASLEEIKCELFEKYPKKYEFVKTLKDSKLKLKNELEQEKLKNSELTDKLQARFCTDIKNFTQNETTKDFQIQIDNREFPVHKFLLAARSPTLAEILKNNPEVENLNLVDISVEIFEIILKFLYTDELPGDDGTNFLQFFAAAGKLKIQDLINFAAMKMIDHIVDENLIEVFKLSNKYEHDELRQRTFDELKRMYPNYKFKETWMTKAEMVVKVIEQCKKNEEAIRKLEEEFQNSDVN